MVLIGESTRKYNGFREDHDAHSLRAGRGSLNSKATSDIDSVSDSLNDGDVGDGREQINLSALIQKNRLTTGFGLGSAPDLPLAWASSTTPSKYILPRNIILGATSVDPSGGEKIKLLSSVGATTIDVPRISDTDLEQIEQKLNSSYMPFYFHDLRTNEVVSFHAFLEDMQDGYNADWNSQTPYGRVEPIHTYKGTTREISLSFYVVATSPNDHMEMWWKINKLTTLLYPQYTAGRQVTTTDGQKFSQPFSQIPGGSPIVRLRLGDLWKSNYSKFNVARAFGLTQGSNNTLTIPGNIQQQQQQQQQQNLSTEISQRIREGRLQPGDQFLIRKSATTPSSRVPKSAMGPGIPENLRGAISDNINPEVALSSAPKLSGLLLMPSLPPNTYVLKIEEVR